MSLGKDTITLEKKKDVALESIKELAEESPEDLGEVSSRVIFAVDRSDSMEHPNKLYSSGAVHEATERGMAIALLLDDNGEMETFPFHNDVLPMAVATAENIDGFVKNFIEIHDTGGTRYMPVLREIMAYVRDANAKLDKAIPTLVYFLTDGDPQDAEESTRYIVDISGEPVFIQFVGIGMRPKLLEKLDTMGGRQLDNVGFSEYDTEKVGEGEMKEWNRATLQEYFTVWLPAARKLGICA